MEENTQHFQDIMLSYFKKGKNTTKVQRNIYAVCREGDRTDQTWQKQFAKFHVGYFLLDNVPWSGRPVEVDSDQIETLTEKIQHYNMWEIANILKVSKSIKFWGKMKMAKPINKISKKTKQKQKQNAIF